MFTKEWSKAKVYKTIVHQGKFYPAPSQQLQGIKTKETLPHFKKKKSLQNSTQKSVVFNAVAYSDFTNIGNYLRYSHLN